METKKKIYTIISVFFILAVFLVMFFIYPLSKEIKQESDDFIIQRNNRLILDNQFSEAINFKQKYDDYKNNLSKIDNLFVDSQNPVDFIEYLEKTAGSAGIEIKISTPSLSKEGKLSYENFQFSAFGKFSNILKFAQTLETGPYLIQIQTLTIGNNKNTQATNKTADIKNIKADILIKVLAKL